MTEFAPVAATPAAAKPKKSATPKVSKAKSASMKAAPSHPSTAEMVNSAIFNLKERNGSSLQAIKKYMVTKYKIDARKSAPFIKKYLKMAINHHYLERTKGKGASGSFKFVNRKTCNQKLDSEEVMKPVAKKSKAATAPKKIAEPKKEKAVNKPKAAAKPKVTKPKAPVKKSPAKAKKPSKTPVAKSAKSLVAKPAKLPVAKPAKSPIAKPAKSPVAKKAKASKSKASPRKTIKKTAPKK